MTEIIQDYISGLPLRQIAKKHYVSHTYIYHHIPKDLRREHHRYKDIHIKHENVCKDYVNGSSLEELAKRYDITKTYVRVLLKNYGVEIRYERKVRKAE